MQCGGSISAYSLSCVSPPIRRQLAVLILVAVASTAVQGQQEQAPEGDNIPVAEIQGIPEEPQIQGGFPPTIPETQIEPVTSEIPNALPIDGFLDDEDCISSSRSV